jgi:hypothetical protein
MIVPERIVSGNAVYAGKTALLKASAMPVVAGLGIVALVLAGVWAAKAAVERLAKPAKAAKRN